ncbi:MFS transporter [Candidatus Nitrosocosmicus arcticus]|uniref:MFS family permease n=1 Tax=Candidatus Nitrosocosmicus arcticus TaxID=2035267 RepID=A0A557SVW3_9ARCH|nr:MFS transporter [Candidatus Nitrosocosmicus arcticus]TVP40745.1 MFS family permease [Candidatus Nitrosocosmicus arcticus]
MNYKWLALSNTTIGTLMASLDRNIVIIALPSIANELHTSLITLVWIAIGYWVVTASMLLTFGRLADMFGRVKMYNLGFALFTFGSGLCCVSQTGEQLIVFRIIQALGAAFIFSNSSAILSDSFPESERGKALGINQISIVVGSVMGLVIGGALTSYFGWRSIFWINIPIGIFATVWAFSKLKELGTIKKEKIDWIGNLLFIGGIVTLLIGITFGSFHLLNTFEIILCILAGISLLVLFYKNEKKVSFPMIDLTLFRIRLFTSSNIAIFFNSLARGAFTFVMVFYLQGPTMLLNPLDSGIYLIPVSLALAIFAPITGWFYDKYRSQIFSQAGMIVSATGFVLLASMGSRISYVDAILPLALIGAGMGIFTSPNRATIMNSVPPNRRGVATGISTTLVMTGSAFSIGLVFLIFSALLPSESIGDIFSGSTISTSYDSIQFSDSNLDRFILSIHIIFMVSALLMISSVLIQYKMN